VWTFIDDLSGVQSANLKWRRDLDGLWPISSTENEVFAQGAGVTAWQTVDMTSDNWPPTRVRMSPIPSIAHALSRHDCRPDQLPDRLFRRGRGQHRQDQPLEHPPRVGGRADRRHGGTNVPPPNVWLRGTHTWPAAADVTDDDPIYFNVEAGPSGTVTSVTRATI
jgi:hypothetical protein